MNTTAAASIIRVSVDRATVNPRGRAATIFVEHFRSASATEKRDVAAQHLLPGEVLQAEAVGEGSLPDTYWTEYAVFTKSR